MSRLLFLAVVVCSLFVVSCSTCSWCRDNCLKTQYVDRVQHVYRYPALQSGAVQPPQYELISADLYMKMKALSGVLQVLEDSKAGCVGSPEQCAVGLTVADVSNLQLLLQELNRLYFIQQAQQTSNFSEAVSFSNILTERLRYYEDAIRSIMEEESRDSSLLDKK